MVAFDGGDDFLLLDYPELPQYEFGLQFWFQQNKIRDGQTLLTWWSEARGREWEIADTSNIFYYHLNNRTQRTGVAINDGKWHHLAFSWRLHCREEVRIAGATYCVQGRNHTSRPKMKCDVDRDCTHVEVSMMVDGVKRSETTLPAFLPSQKGQMIIGQSMQKPYKTTEIRLRDEYTEEIRRKWASITSNLPHPFSDNQLQLIFSRLRSGYYNNTNLFAESLSKQAREALFCEGEPWREPHTKYCDSTAPGGFKPDASLSANIDEFRIYNYYRTEWDITLGMNDVIHSDGFYTISPEEGNWSLLLYYNFDLRDREFYHTSKDDISNWPLVVRDESPIDDTMCDQRCRYPGQLGGGIFQWAPLRVPSTAPIWGSRTVQIVVPDSTQRIPINLVDLVFDPDTPSTGIFSRIEEKARFGTLYQGADDCDSVETVVQISSATSKKAYVKYRPEGCRGSIIGFFTFSTFQTGGCHVGQKITASDPYGSGLLATISQVNVAGAIQRIDVESMGRGYDWTYEKMPDLAVDSANCTCAGSPGDVAGNLNKCYRPIISQGKATTTGDFAGFDMQQNNGAFAVKNGLPVFYEVACTQPGAEVNCAGVKPRPCKWGCHRDMGWMTDVSNPHPKPTQVTTKSFVGPFSMYPESGFETVYWSNEKHTIWYYPEHLREAKYYIKDSEGKLILQDTIKDEFIVRFYDELPLLDALVAQANPDFPTPFIHVWIQIVYEKLALPLNTSIIWEESSAMLIQLHVVDFDRGTNVLNSPFSVFADPPSNGILYQAVRLTRKDNETEFDRECVCPTRPSFPKMNRLLEDSKYPLNTDLPGLRPCDVSKIGQFCFKKGDPITRRDSLVESTVDIFVRPGFQHARDGMFVIYDMGIEMSGTSQFYWRLKHPQGQVVNATVDIQVRSINNRPVAFDASIVTDEDTFKEVKLVASDVDDVRTPAMYITEFPVHGTLYQCIAESSSSPCQLGERFSRINETEPQWADVRVDLEGAIDDGITAVLRVLDLDDPGVQRTTRNHANTSTVLSHGYGFGSYDFDPDKADNFRKLCGIRGSIAADLLLKSPIFVTDIDFFYPIRSDTPFRFLAQRERQFEHISYDYNSVGNVLQDFEVADTKVTYQGLNYKEYEDGIHFVDSGKWRAEQSFSFLRVDCGQATGAYNDQTSCQKTWNGTGYVRGEQRATITEETERWFELFRGLPHQAQAEYDRMSPVFADTLFQTTRLRIEACGANMRVFGEETPNFLEKVHRVRVWGGKTQRSKGSVTARDRRVVYVPDNNYAGTDTFKFRVQDHAGGALRSSSQFSLQRHWSPVVNVDIIVRAKNDLPLATSVVASQVLGTATSEVVISTPGVHPGLNGDGPQKVSTFDIEIARTPVRGSVVLSDGQAATATLVSYNGILKYRTSSMNGCGRPYDEFEYRVKNSGTGDNQYSRTHKVTIDVRCKTGFTCDLPTLQCKACPTGTYGEDSAIEYTCHACPAGTYQGGSAAKSCTPCPPGSFNPKPGAEKCKLCPEGTFNALESQVSCSACPGGTHAPFSGLFECWECGSKHWTLATGSFTCKDCPVNTRARVQVAPDISFCECEHGYYNVHGKSGVECLPCPVGAYCHGRNLLPVARTGYWTNQDIWTDDYEDMETGDITFGHAHFVPCTFRYLRGVCIGYPEIDVQQQEERCQYRDHQVIQGPVRLDDFSSEGVNFNISSCTLRDLSVPGEEAPEGLRSWIMRQDYTANSYCSEGYTGVICSDCSENFYRGLTGYCFKCSSVYKIPVLGFVLFIVIAFLNLAFWIVMFVTACHRSRSMYITISHFQLVAMLAKMGVPWPDYIQGPVFFSSLFNLAMDGAPWGCVGVRSTFDVRWIMEMFAPVFIVLGIYVSYYYQVNEALSNIRATEAQERDGGGESAATRPPAKVSTVRPGTGKLGTVAEAPNININSASNALEGASVTTKDESIVSEGENDGSSSEGSAVDDDEKERLRLEALLASKKNTSRDEIRLLTPKEIRKLRDAGIWYTSMSLNVLFVMAISTLLLPFSCSQVSDTLHYLECFPDFSCGTSTHDNYIFLSYVFALAWGIVFPSIMVYILRKAWYNELVMDRLFKRQFGWLFDCYEARYFWWEIAVLFRKAFIVGVAGTITDNTYIQLVLLIVFLSTHLFWTFYMNPHIHDRHNVVDIFLQIQFLILLTFALSNLVGNDGMKIVTYTTGIVNDNVRIKILEPEPDMDVIADKNINSDVITNISFMVVMIVSAIGNLFMVLYDLYESRVHAPKWAPYLWNATFGCELWYWDEFVSNVLSNFDLVFTKIRDRKKVKPPTRPASRWAHRVMMIDGVAKVDDFSTLESVEAMLAAAVANTQEEEWARDKESCNAYIRSLEKRLFASEMYNSKAANLPILERQRNLAKKLLVQFLYDESGQVFRALYDQTGLNEETVWDIQELDRLRQEKAIIEVGEVDHRKYLLKENDEQKRRVGSVASWKVKYEDEMKRCQVSSLSPLSPSCFLNFPSPQCLVDIWQQAEFLGLFVCFGFWSAYRSLSLSLSVRVYVCLCVCLRLRVRLGLRVITLPRYLKRKSNRQEMPCCCII